MSRVAPSLPPEPIAANSNDWWCDVAGTGCQRPRPGKYLPSRHYKDRNFFVCEVCYAGGPLALKLHTVRAEQARLLVAVEAVLCHCAA